MRFLTSLICFLLIITTLQAQTDNCRPLLPMAVGTEWEITHYNAKGKAEGSMTLQLQDVKEEGDASVYTIFFKAYDKRNEEIYEHTYEARCSEGEFSVDMDYFMNGEMMEAFGEMDVSVEGTDLKMPDFSTPAGTTLPDGEMNINVDTGTAFNINMTTRITDRKVSAHESITTPAGTFDCMVVEQKMEVKAIVKTETSSKEWFAPEVGMVRSESYNRKGKLESYSELTKITYP
ncbi:MAG: hypothetical protein AAGJ82_15245 [Bacteroidota bacterium]